MEVKRTKLLAYFASVSLLASLGLMAQIFAGWVPPVNLGSAVNSAANDQ